MKPTSRDARERSPKLQVDLRGQGTKAWLVCLAILLGCALACAREFPPLVPPPKPAVLPSPAVRVLPNGLAVAVIERHRLPLLTLHLMVKAGAEADPQDLPGTAQLVTSVLTQGTTHRNAQQIAQAIDNVGGSIETAAEWDVSRAAVSVLTDHTELAFDLLADIAIRPTFLSAEVERKRKQTLSALEVAQDDAEYLADTAFRRMVFAESPYGHPVDGTLEAVRRITPKDLRDFHARHYRPSNSILAVVGHISSEEAFRQAVRFFGTWRDHPAPVSSTEPAPAAGHRQIVIIDKPDAVQTEIRIGNPGITRASPEYYALSVANQILGGPATNRLFKALRSQRGLTYGASSELVSHRASGSWLAKTSTRTQETARALDTALEEMKRLRDHPISQQELMTAQAYLVGHLALEFESSDGITNHVLELLVYNLPLDYWSVFAEKIRKLTPEEVLAATRRYLDAQPSVIVLVGSAENFKHHLKKFGPLRVIPARSADASSMSLEQGTGASENPDRRIP